jgi:hypothetical protein
LPLARGQLSDLATTADGGQLYFSTVFRQKGTEQSANPKIVRWERRRGFELFAERERVYPSGGANVSNYYRLTRPQVSADGRVVAYEAQRDCQGGSSCVFVNRSTAEFIGGVEHRVLGQAWLSTDGRRAVVSAPTLPGSYTNYWRDLSTGREFSLPSGPLPVNAVFFTEAGTALIAYGTTYYFSDGSYQHALPDLTGQPNCRIAVWNKFVCGDDLVGLSDDGARSLRLKSAILEIVEGTQRRLIARDVTAAILSGYGNVVYYTTRDNRLMRYEVVRAASEELTGPTPVLGNWTGGVAPGALNFVLDTDTRSVRMNGRPVETAGEGRFLVPLDIAPGPVTLTGFIPTSSFESVSQVRAAKASDPEFIQFGVHIPGSYGPVIVNQDFSAVIDHVAPGQIVHFYLTGLGGMRPTCAAETLYGGPAPGIPGVDQLTIRVPADTRNFFVLSCGEGVRAQVFVPVQ